MQPLANGAGGDIDLKLVFTNLISISAIYRAVSDGQLEVNLSCAVRSIGQGELWCL